MKILVISHNVFSNTTNMGKTLKSYFINSEEVQLAQLYVHSEIPTDEICKNYYRMTDKEIIRSILTKKSGRIFTENDIEAQRANPRTDSGRTAKLYQFARRRTPMIYFMRNLWWRLGAWKTKKLLSWVDDFSPDAVFFASGDYSFLYRVAKEIAEYKKIPLAVVCMDDYYLFNRNHDKIGGRILHRLFMRQVNKTMDRARCIFAICDKMSRDYAELFKKPCYTLRTPATISAPLNYAKSNKISYIGNLGYRRNEQLVALGQALRKLNLADKPEFIDVYTGEKREAVLATINEDNGLRYRGSISAGEVLRVMGESLAVIHTESFDEDIRKSVAYSVSTKIADSLVSGTCILAYGPSGVASMEYLQENDAAVCITSSDKIEDGLLELLSSATLREKCVSNALKLAKQNHDSEKNNGLIMNVLEGICQRSGAKQ